MTTLTHTPAPPLAPILQHLNSRPSRTWSIVITVFGDAVAPRGGTLWLGSLIEMFAGMGIGGGVVRTAMSRLATDEWLQRSRIGRHSFYRLTGKGRVRFADATARIYGTPPQQWDGRFRLALPDINGDREGLRAALGSAGFGTLSPGVWIAPPGPGSVSAGPAGNTRVGTALPADIPLLLHLECCTDAETGRQVAERAWPLHGVAEAYARFTEAFTPLHTWIEAAGGLTDLDALLARILLIHEYRRVVLRDPLLPLPLLPAPWPGQEARLLCSVIYAALLPGSERWLDAHGRDEHGPLPAPSINLGRRFAAAQDSA